MNDNEDVPIKDAATVILLREKKDSTYVLMGQRGNKAVFMPSKYVFPGGAVDEDDSKVKLFKSIDGKGIDLLHQYSKKKIAKELCVAAIRELWEEAGLRLCAKVDDVGRALYFSRACIPTGSENIWHHIGIYAWRRDILEKFVKLKPSPLEKSEKLEQLRALESGMQIHTIITSEHPIGVDTKSDLKKAENYFKD